MDSPNITAFKKIQYNRLSPAADVRVGDHRHEKRTCLVFGQREVHRLAGVIHIHDGAALLLFDYFVFRLTQKGHLLEGWRFGIAIGAAYLFGDEDS